MSKNFHSLIYFPFLIFLFFLFLFIFVLYREWREEGEGGGGGSVMENSHLGQLSLIWIFVYLKILICIAPSVHLICQLNLNNTMMNTVLNSLYDKGHLELVISQFDTKQKQKSIIKNRKSFFPTHNLYTFHFFMLFSDALLFLLFLFHRTTNKHTHTHTHTLINRQIDVHQIATRTNRYYLCSDAVLGT